MANNDSTLRDNGKKLLDAGDKLSEAKSLVCFVQSISLNGGLNEAVILQAAQLTGFYHVTQNAIDRIKEAEELIEQVRAAREAPEVLAA